MKKIRKYLVPLLLSLAMISQIFVAYGLEKDNTVNIIIFHTNDIHGRHAQGSENIQIGNLATLKKNTQNSVLVDAGDNLHGLPFVNLSQGMDAVELMKSAGYDYMAPGNHDFNYGQERLLELAAAARSNDGFEIMAANVLKNNNTILKANDIKIIDGIKIGFFGLATTETTYKTNPNNVAGLEFKNPIDSAKEQVKDLKDKGAEVIIAIAHVGMDGSSNPTSIDIASKVQGIDVIVDGHSHTTLNNGKVVGNTLIVSTGEYLKNIGKVKISVDKTSKNIVSKSARLMEKEEVLKNVSDPAIEAKVNSIKEQQKPLLSEIIGKNTIKLDGERQNVRTKESFRAWS